MKTITTQKKLVSLTIFSILYANQSPIYAQTTEPEQEEISIELIEVTAQRVGQSIQEVPISITAINGEALKRRQIDSFDQLQFVAPGVSFNEGINARQSATTIRGIGTGLFNIGIEASVAVVVDDITMGREGAGIFDFNDVERIEVLRGPQGTLFGKNASAGVVSIITKGPTDYLETELNLALGSFNEINANAAISGPLNDSLSYRISAYTNTRDGYIDNVNPTAIQHELNERDEQGIRAKLKFQSDDSEWLFSADYVTRDQASGVLTPRQSSPGGPGTGLLGFGVPLIGTTLQNLGIVLSEENRQVAPEGLYFSDMQAWGLGAKYNKKFGNYDFESITSYREWTSVDNNDADMIPLPLLETNIGDLSQDQFSQEFRLHSPRGQKLTYTLGALYFTQSMNQTNVQRGTAGLDILGVLPPGLLLGTHLDSNIDETNYAVFGQGEYALSDNLFFIAGARLLRSELEGDQQRNVAENSVGPYAGQSASTGPESAEDNDTAVAWRFGARYVLNENTNYFATISRGYKAAGIVTGLTIAPDSDGNLPVVAPEVPTQYELGIRSVTSDGNLVTNLTAFYLDVDDFQAQTLVPGEDGTNIFAVSNAGSVDSQGFELDITAYFDVGLTLSVAAAYTDAEFAEFLGAPCYALQTLAQGCVTNAGVRSQDLAGKRLANSPKWVINSLARYDFEIGGYFGFWQTGLQYRSDNQFSITNDPNTIEDDITLIDMQLGMDFLDDSLSVVLFGRNLTDKTFAEAIVGTPFDTGAYAQFNTLESERTFGIRLSYIY
jgi:iron complex outermembrane receptor protein